MVPSITEPVEIIELLPTRN